VRVGGGELDLVVERGGLVVVCEVKYRDPRSGHDALEALRPAQRARLRRATGAWLAGGALGVERVRRVRLDLVAIGGPGQIVVVEDAW
jgi:Holliday junction resolvase-like predicted endonuclease